MTYRLVYTHRAVRDINALDTKVKQRIGKTLRRYESDPLKHAESLRQSALGSYRFRIGDYRVVFDLARMIHERFCCNRRFTAATGLRPAGSPLGSSPYCMSTLQTLQAPRAGLAT